MNKKLSSMISKKKSNTKKIKNLLEKTLVSLKKQGRSGFITNDNPVYFDKQTNTCCVIGLMVGSDIHKKQIGLQNLYSEISNEAQKPIVANIIRNIGYNVDHEFERGRLVSVLQEVQDTHDFTFSYSGDFNKQYPEFESKVKQIIESL